VKRLTVNVSQEVEQQIREQVFYIANDSLDNALAWEGRLLSALDHLGEVHGHSVDEDASRRLGGTVRKMVFEKTYLIHYEVNDAAGVVEIVNFRHGARLPDSGER
jgi:plasmid stabilization system protein ParE